MIGVYKSESLKPVIDADHMPFHQIIRKLGLGVQDGEEANLGTQMLGVSGDGAQGF